MLNDFYVSDKSIVRSDGAKNKQFDWLQNSSFKKEDAKLLTQIQQAQDRYIYRLFLLSEQQLTKI